MPSHDSPYSSVFGVFVRLSDLPLGWSGYFDCGVARGYVVYRPLVDLRMRVDWFSLFGEGNFVILLFRSLSCGVVLLVYRCWLRIHDYVVDTATCGFPCSYDQIFAIVYDFRCLLVGLKEPVGCVRRAVNFAVVDGELTRDLLGLVGQHDV